MLYLLRHGETVFNIEGRYQGGCDSPLTARGSAQARCIGAHLARLAPCATLWVSPLPRAQASADLIAAEIAQHTGAPPARQLRTELREIALGDWDGLTRAEMEALAPGFRKRHPRRQWMFHAPGGEPLDAVLARLAQVHRAARAHPGDLVLVTHAFTGRLLRGLHAGLPLEEAVTLTAPQDAFHLLAPDGRVEAIDASARP
ncbi:histidine phosphatase family protein [Rhodobacter maris]|uniref:histidine phosphatase family protein n=1 Tax=Rhodobacter maris TaxID=446682 RepID=UPI001596D43A|nr:histidine phosphatase family protein [Rhodobacter maris]